MVNNDGTWGTVVRTATTVNLDAIVRLEFDVIDVTLGELLITVVDALGKREEIVVEEVIYFECWDHGDCADGEELSLTIEDFLALPAWLIPVEPTFGYDFIHLSFNRETGTCTYTEK